MGRQRDPASATKAQHLPPESFQILLDSTDEASLLWDEYKYRHDLIWRHLIRSTLALVALLTIRYADALAASRYLVGFAFLAALLYWIITLFAIERELRLYYQVRFWHRCRQYHLLGLHQPVQPKPEAALVKHDWGRIFFVPGFPRRVGAYLLLLLAATPLMGLVKLCPDGIEFGFDTCQDAASLYHGLGWLRTS